jgi:hypothetical protein
LDYYSLFIGVYKNEINSTNINLSKMVNDKDSHENTVKTCTSTVQDDSSNLKRILQLQIDLRVEQLKNNVLMDIIKNHSSISLKSVIKQTSNALQISSFSGGNISVVVQDFMKKYSYTMNKKTDKKKKKKKKKKRPNINPPDNINFVLEESDEEEFKREPVYKRVSGYIRSTEQELGNKLKKEVIKGEEQRAKIKYDNFDVSHKRLSDIIDGIFDTIMNSRTYSGKLKQIKNTRKQLLGRLNLDEYTSLLNNHNNKIKKIFKDRDYPMKKIQKIIAMSLTPLDMRLSFYQGYTESVIDIDDVQKFGLALDFLVNHPRRFIPFDNQLLYKRIQNYGLALFELGDCIKRCIVNTYKYHNVIYVPKKESSRDPYSFYILEKVLGNRCWHLKCRLEYIAIDFSQNVLLYCIRLFRKIYKDIFNDNVFRSDYMSKSRIAEFDCEQLLQNIILLSKPFALCRTFQKIIIDNCTFTNSTHKDKFRLHADDKHQRHRFKKGKDTIEHSCDIVRRLFDNINQDNVCKVVEERFYSV